MIIFFIKFKLLYILELLSIRRVPKTLVNVDFEGPLNSIEKQNLCYP